jgi:hypothetical protein
MNAFQKLNIWENINYIFSIIKEIKGIAIS